MLEIVAKIVLIDIEGTTTSISFVHDILFPYAKENAESYLKSTWQSETTEQIVQDLQLAPQFAEFAATVGPEAATTVDVELITKFVHYLIDKDLKVTPLKTLQGLIWAKGYAEGQLKGHVYDDVPSSFRAWRDAGLGIAVYSSGSVAAQKLIFQHSVKGNLLTQISAHFDTHVGHKQQQESYKNIAKDLKVDPQQIVFLTDVLAEAEAAKAAGMQTVILQRPGNLPLTIEQKSTYQLVDNFSALKLIKSP